MPFLHIPSGAAGEVIAATVALFLILLAAVIAANAVIACRARNPVQRPNPAARRAQPAAHPQGGTP